MAVYAICAARVCLAADAPSDALLDEIGAASDANTALIQRGVAKYRLAVTRYSPAPSPVRVPGEEWPKPDGQPRGPYTGEMTVYFDYPRLRFEWRGERPTVQGDVDITSEWTIFHGEYKISYSLISKARVPGDYHVRIDAASGEVTSPHPRESGCPDWSFASDDLARTRANGRLKLIADREADELVRVTGEAGTSKRFFWLSPDQAYGVVESKWWHPRAPEPAEPYLVYEATYREAGNGAFVVDHRLIHKHQVIDGEPRRDQDLEVTLLEIELRNEMDPKLFTLDGLGLPAGAKIFDAVAGRHYEYAVPAVAESQIEPPSPKGQAIGRPPWLTGVFIATGLGLAGLLGWKLTRGRTARPRGSNGNQDGNEPKGG